MGVLEEIRALIKRGDWYQAACQAERCAGDGNRTADERAESALLACNAAYRNLDLCMARRCASLAVQLAETCGQIRTQGLALYNLCSCCAALSEYQEAVRAGEAFLAGLQRWTDLSHLAGRCLVNIGMVHKERNRYPEALQAFNRTILYTQGEKPDVALIVKARHLASWVLIDMGVLDEAAEHLDLIREMLAEVPEYACDDLVHRGYLALHRKNYPEVERLAAQVLTQRVDREDRHMALAFYLKGMVALAQDAIDSAQAYAQMGIQCGMKCGIPAFMNMLTGLLGDITARRES